MPRSSFPIELGLLCPKTRDKNWVALHSKMKSFRTASNEGRQGAVCRNRSGGQKGLKVGRQASRRAGRLPAHRRSHGTRALRSCSARACKFQTSVWVSFGGGAERVGLGSGERRLTSSPPFPFAQADLSIVMVGAGGFSSSAAVHEHRHFSTHR